MVTIMSKTPQGVNQLLIDVTLSEGHEGTNIISEYTIEDGSVVTDHVRRVPETITIEFLTTDTPITIVEPNSGKTQIRPDASNRVQLTFDTVLEFAGFQIDKQDDEFAFIGTIPQQLTIITGVKIYTNMIIKSFKMFRTPEIGQSLRPVIVFQRLRRTRSEFFLTPNVSELDGKAPGITNQAQKNRDQGVTKTKDVEDNSVLFNIANNKLGIKKRQILLSAPPGAL